MLAADIGIGASGTSTWERACLGLPTVSLAIAENQKTIQNNLRSAGLILPAQSAEEAIEQLLKLASDPTLMNSITTKSLLTVGGLGTWHAVQKSGLMGHSTNPSDDLILRDACLEDVKIVYQWQTQPGQRRFSRNPNPPNWEQHQRWWAANNNDPTAYTFIAEKEERPVGMVRLNPPSKGFEAPDALIQEAWEVSIIIDASTQGEGIGYQALSRLGLITQSLNLLAHIHPQNTPSIKLFKKCAYQAIGPTSYIRPAGKTKFTSPFVVN
jgi:RimJ/RimL family protein N-acetyltransferase